MGRVVNARRGMSTATDRRLYTTEAAGKRPRLMPEQIYREAKDRDDAIRLLRRHGYITGRATPAKAAPAKAAPAPVPAKKAAAPKPVAPAKAAPAPKPVVPKKAVPPVKAAPKPSSLGDRVKAGIVDRQVLSGGQNARTELLTLADGSKVVFKKAKPIEGVPARFQQDAEELVPMVLRALGLRAPEIYRPSANQLYMEYFDGTLAAKMPKVPGRFTLDPDAYDADQGLLLGLADQLVDNYDRNLGNWLIDAGGNVLPIDHGFSFTFYGSTTPDVPTLAVGDQPSSHFHAATPPRSRWADNDMSPADMAVARDRLSALRPEFERLGRGDLHDKMMTRLGHLERHAKGTKRRIR